MSLSKHSPDADVAPVRICLSSCVVLSFFVTCTDDPHRLKRVLKSQVRSQLIYLSIVELIVDVPQCLRILELVISGSHRKQNSAWERSRDSMTTNMVELLRTS